MKFNIAYPANGTQGTIEIDKESEYRGLYDKRMSQEFDGELLGEQYKGYIFRITGGNDKQGFPMKQGVLLNQRTRLLLAEGHSCYRPRRSGERQRKSVRGCIVGPDIAILNLVVVKKGENDIANITDVAKPRKLGPKRATKIRRLFNLSKEDDVRKHVIRHEKKTKKGDKTYTKAPKIQRLVTPVKLQRKRQRLLEKQRRAQKQATLAKEYKELIATRRQEAKDSAAAKTAAKKEKREARIAKKVESIKSAVPKGKAAPAATSKSAASPASAKAPSTKPPAAKPPAKSSTKAEASTAKSSTKAPSSTAKTAAKATAPKATAPKKTTGKK